jgi:tetratricopeptide (TPR) repeat protein
MGAKQYDQAVGTFQKAASLRSSDFLPHFYIGQSYTAADRYVDSEAPLHKALTLAADATERSKIYNQLGFVYAKQGKHDQAIDAYNKAGNGAEAARVAQNKQIAAENAEADKHNATIEQLKAEQERLKKEMESLPGGPPRR